MNHPRCVFVVLAGVVATALTGCGSTAPTTAAKSETYRVGTWNMAGGNPSYGDVGTTPDALAQSMRSRRIDLMLLQEMCEGQLERLQRKLGASYTVRFISPGPNLRCHSGGGQWDQRGSSFGLGIVWRNTRITGQVAAPIRLPPGVDPEPRSLACLRVQEPRAMSVCVTHFTALSGPRETATRSREARAVRSALLPDVLADRPVILGGDLNSHPDWPELDPLFLPNYGGGAFGPFLEADAGPSDEHGDYNRRRGGPTTRGGNKLDYLFVSPLVHVVEAGPGTTDVSDHLPLWATVQL